LPTTPPHTREPISKKLRFEVFKRDSFRCQYCGAAAPEAVLVIDHVTPVVNGGKSDILNLITSCDPCNAGKGKRLLSDNTAITKQLDQLKELNERREQLDMLIQWREELGNLKEETLSRIAEYWSKHVPGYSLTEHGMRSLRKILHKFELQEVIDAIPIAAEHYLEFDNKGKPIQDSVDLAWNKIQGICHTRRLEKRKPYIRDLYYIRTVLRNRVTVNEDYIMVLLESAVTAGVDVEDLKEEAKRCSSWSAFKRFIEARIDDLT